MRGASYYLFWMLAPTLLAALSAHPQILLLAVVALVARRWLPDPWMLLRQSGRMRSLRSQIEANPDNATARAQLARLYLDRQRPARAIPLLEAALARDAGAAELHFLLGRSRRQAGRAAAALAPLVEAVKLDERLLYGEPYLEAADALCDLRRFEEAEDAYERFLAINGSSLEGWCKLSRVRDERRDREGARAALREAIETWKALPPFQRRHQLLWYLRVRLAALLA